MELLKGCIEKEKQLTILRQNAKGNSEEIASTLEAIRNDYRKVLISAPQLPSSLGKDIHGMLWKQGFYKQIEDFRKSIQKTIQIIEGNPDTTVIMQEKGKIHLLRLSSALYKFLSDSLQFYQDFYSQLESRYVTSEIKEEILKSMHRCLLYMGDLARYKELYSENKRKEYSVAAKYYQRAATLIPASGNPQNQLAVLAIYSKIDIDAVYHYCRSILVGQPFSAAYDNLIILFDKNLKMHNDSNSNINDHNDRGEVGGQDKLNKLMKKFIRLHAMLFDYTKQIIQTKLDLLSLQIDFGLFHNLLSSASTLEEKSKILNKLTAYAQIRKKSFTLPQFNVYFFEELTQYVFQDLENLITNSTYLNGRLLMILLIICIFSVHHSSVSNNLLGMSSIKANDDSESSITADGKIRLAKPKAYIDYIRSYLLDHPDKVILESTKPHEYSTPESLSLTLLYNFVTR